jgi:hypothetical protein
LPIIYWIIELATKINVVPFFTVCATVVAIATLIYVGRQTSLLRKQLRGEVYTQARVSDLCFYLPDVRKHKVKGFKQDKEESLGSYIAIPVGLERELHIKWTMAECQTLTGYTVGFASNSGSQPQLLGNTYAFVTERIQGVTRDEFIDWHGNYHCEYMHRRRFPKGEDFVTAFRVKGITEGSYLLRVSVRVDDAPREFNGDLKLDCLKEPNGWAEEHWCPEE